MPIEICSHCRKEFSNYKCNNCGQYKNGLVDAELRKKYILTILPQGKPNYYEIYLAKDKRLHKLLNLFEAFRYRLKFDESMISHRVHYDTWNRYFIFSIDLIKFLKSNWSSTREYINEVESCNRCKDIGTILNRKHFKVLIVYYTTSGKFRFYVNIYERTIRMKNLSHLSRLDDGWRENNMCGEKVCPDCSGFGYVREEEEECDYCNGTGRVSLNTPD